MPTATTPTIAKTREGAQSPTLPPTPATPTPPADRNTPASAPSGTAGTATRSSVATATRGTVTATRGTATPSPVVQPRGTVPTGWKIYQSALFAIAYPSDWRLDDRSASG